MTPRLPTEQVGLQVIKNYLTPDRKQVDGSERLEGESDHSRTAMSYGAPIKSSSTKPRGLGAKTPTSYPSSSTTFSSSKKDKRTIKHSTFVSKIAKNSATGNKKRRRPSKKLVTTLESLADALPDLGDENISGNTSELLKQANFRHKSLKTRPGSMKRKVKMEKAERERFGMNMAQLASVQKGAGGVAGGLEALRRHIAEQMKSSG
ncbi:hypothetical protein NA57DRAFT_73874 [Rhizodiscina lignyota]|uniref:Ribosome biogenesis protein SLX9 n=1 Tax=Rhizodiscina lignyota TaxID=1504668 RepID=A0A9P4IHU1_9PEZI|nr:hypothetical protein NA57DRAFT_73874 [Rhizodiscina lignyota]